MDFKGRDGVCRKDSGVMEAAALTVYLLGVFVVFAYPHFNDMGREEEIIGVVALLWPVVLFVFLPLALVFERWQNAKRK